MSSKKARKSDDPSEVEASVNGVSCHSPRCQQNLPLIGSLMRCWRSSPSWPIPSCARSPPSTRGSRPWPWTQVSGKRKGVNDLYGPVHNVFDVGRHSTWASGRGLGPESGVFIRTARLPNCLLLSPSSVPSSGSLGRSWSSGTDSWFCKKNRTSHYRIKGTPFPSCECFVSSLVSLQIRILQFTPCGSRSRLSLSLKAEFQISFS